ncbi:hypothetical protein [Haliangium sp.]|uniref:hypothetical protein n=1 Tax=Haliangium sp. TaxID=2663208 RepID=UPI003D0EE491
MIAPVSFLAVDWSGARDRGGAPGIWIAEARAGRLVDLRGDLDRDQAVAHILAHVVREPHTLVGLDFAFSMPAWFLRSRGLHSARDLWTLAAREGEAWLAQCPPPFWGRPGVGKPAAAPERPPLRHSERELARATGSKPKSVFQIGGAGAVGTGSIRGMPYLSRLLVAGITVWPFETPHRPPRLPVAVEIYPRLFTGPVVKKHAHARRDYLDRHFAGQDPVLSERAAGSEDAFDAAVSAWQMSRIGQVPTALAPDTHPDVLLEGRIWPPPDQLAP